MDIIDLYNPDRINKNPESCIAKNRNRAPRFSIINLISINDVKQYINV